MRQLLRMSLAATIAWALAASLPFVERAQAQAPVCETATGDCFMVNDTPGCDDVVTTTGDCCELVCAADGWCCAFDWDNICVQTAFDLCNLPLGACCNFNGVCTNDTQERFCKDKGSSWSEDKRCPKDDDPGADEIVCAAIPTVSEWGLIVMTLLGCTIGTVVFGRRRHVRQIA